MAVLLVRYINVVLLCVLLFFFLFFFHEILDLSSLYWTPRPEEMIDVLLEDT